MSRVVPGIAAEAVQRETLAMRRMTESLVEDLSENVPVDQVTSAVGAAHHRFTGKPIREFVPILVERIVRRELADPDPTVRVPAPRGERGGYRTHRARIEYDRGAGAAVGE